ncbi:MAG: hypothetical protein IJG87_05000 [Ruminococcus sp.]|nr:hypothetical protein [Ruminococcus sp.]
MKNQSIIIKIAVGVSAAASLFSLVTLIRAAVIGSNIVFPVIQVIGSAAIFAVCLILFRALSAAKEEDAQETDDGGTEAEDDRDDEGSDGADQAADELYEKYHLSDFENKNQE